MRREFIQTLANEGLENTELVKYASHELHKITLSYPESIGVPNKVNVLDLVNALSKQRIAPEEQNEVARVFSYSVKGNYAILKQLPEHIQKVVSSLTEIFTEQKHSDLSATVALKMFEKIVRHEHLGKVNNYN